MAVKKDEWQKRPLGDPAVDVHMGAGWGETGAGVNQESTGSAGGGIENDPVYGLMSARAKKLRSLSASQRNKLKRDESRKKVTYDLQESLTRQVNAIAREGGFPAAHLVALFIHRGLKDLQAGRLDLEPHMVASYVPRFICFLLLEPETDEWGNWEKSS